MERSEGIEAAIIALPTPLAACDSFPRVQSKVVDGGASLPFKGRAGVGMG